LRLRLRVVGVADASPRLLLLLLLLPVTLEWSVLGLMIKPVAVVAVLPLSWWEWERRPPLREHGDGVLAADDIESNGLSNSNPLSPSSPCMSVDILRMIESERCVRLASIVFCRRFSSSLALEPSTMEQIHCTAPIIDVR
jgi:hypothetical protein